MSGLLQTMKKTDSFPLVITEQGVSAKIRKAWQVKGESKYQAFVVEFILFGKRKRVWRSDLDDANVVAVDACKKIANGVQSSLELKDTDRMSENASRGVFGRTRPQNKRIKHLI
jgi:hypothetical protein